MYVVETAAGSMETMKITIINSSGADWVVDVLPEFPIDKLKLMALSHFFNPIDSIKVADRYKLILVSQSRPLSDEGTVRDEDIKENDELLLLKKRTAFQPICETQEEKEEKSRGPTESEIQKETASVTKRNVNNVVEDPPVAVDFHTELRKILVSLVKTSEKLLRYHPEVIALFKEMAEGEHVSVKCNKDSVDRNAVKQLTDMGFPESKAIHALKLHSNLSEATDWLLLHAKDSSPDSEEAAPEPMAAPSISSEFSRLNVSESVATRGAEIEETPAPSTSQEENTEGQSQIVQMIRCFRAYKRKIFRPNTAALANLKEMGFEEPDVLDALRINGNNQDSACEWLLSDTKSNFEDVEEGLDPEGPIYKSIMTNSIVQLGLSNPKTFLALLHMLENPSSACRWLSDPDTAPILSQIFRIYHAEKHSLQLGRPFSQ